MPELNMIQALNSALHEEMERDDAVVVLGEDVGTLGGVFRVTVGLKEKYGAERCIDTPLAESGIIGTSIGMALYGLRPVPEIQFADFIFPAFDQIVNEAAKMRWRSGGQFSVPMTIRTPYGGGIRGGLYHSQSPEAYFCHTPGLKVVVPSNPSNAKGLLLGAIRDPDPVVFLEPKRIYRASKGEVPEGDGALPIGKASRVREGEDITVVSWGAMLQDARAACEQASGEGISCELLDLQTLLPLDSETVLESVRKSGRCVVVQEAPKTCGYAAEVSAMIGEKAILSLKAPVRRVAGWDTPFPHTLEKEYLPDPGRILNAIRETVRF